MVDCYLLIGDGSVGKSATVRALTGIRVQEQAWPVRYADGVHKTFVLMRSAQEGSPTLPSNLIADILSSGSQRALITLRFAPFNSAPSANDYISALGSQGWAIKGIGLIGDGLAGITIPSACIVVRMARRPLASANERAAYLRTGWQIF